MPFIATWIQPKIIILSEVREKQILCDITYMWNLSYSIKKPNSKQKQTHKQRNQTYDCQGEKTRVEVGWEYGVSRCKLLHLQEKQGPTVSAQETMSNLLG